MCQAAARDAAQEVRAVRPRMGITAILCTEEGPQCTPDCLLIQVALPQHSGLAQALPPFRADEALLDAQIESLQALGVLNRRQWWPLVAM